MWRKKFARFANNRLLTTDSTRSKRGLQPANGNAWRKSQHVWKRNLDARRLKLLSRHSRKQPLLSARKERRLRSVRPLPALKGVRPERLLRRKCSLPQNGPIRKHKPRCEPESRRL